MGGAFLVAALAAWVWHVIADGRFDPGQLVRQVLVGAVFVIACSFAGKVIGVGIGRLRYIVIRRRIRRLRETEASPRPHVPVG